ncbi:hypothetical protein SCHPADRAFT_930270 [Schizopora paradoxa]|uniref:Uncharacterized protein n=1 Tax=Schizopora paradoxa TaxID=27342 RepID=A0A0H2RH44_9AGAM|nr:hypothetical protein SCHPADRAFT_930270 [Schizopora paradoxa]
MTTISEYRLPERRSMSSKDRVNAGSASLYSSIRAVLITHLFQVAATLFRLNIHRRRKEHSRKKGFSGFRRIFQRLRGSQQSEDKFLDKLLSHLERVTAQGGSSVGLDAPSQVRGPIDEGGRGLGCNLIERTNGARLHDICFSFRHSTFDDPVPYSSLRHFHVSGVRVRVDALVLSSLHATMTTQSSKQLTTRLETCNQGDYALSHNSWFPRYGWSSWRYGTFTRTQDSMVVKLVNY